MDVKFAPVKNQNATECTYTFYPPPPQKKKKKKNYKRTFSINNFPDCELTYNLL